MDTIPKAVGVAEANTPSGMRSVMRNWAICPATIVLAVLAGRCGGEPATTVQTAPATGKLITNSIGMKLTLIPAGEFMMGSPDSDSAGRQHREATAPGSDHQAVLSRRDRGDARAV